MSHSSLVLHERADSFAEVLTRMADVRGEFQREYQAMLHTVLARDLPTIVCTVYDSIPGLAPAQHTGLCLFNEVILREAFCAGVPVVDLRLICNESSDYARSSPIEPSVAGGGKIARAISRAINAMRAHDQGVSIVFA